MRHQTIIIFRRSQQLEPQSGDAGPRVSLEVALEQLHHFYPSERIEGELV
jgi:hypothetical protein